MATAPHTYTPSEFQDWKRRSGRKNATYQGYQRYVTNTRTQRAAQRAQSAGAWAQIPQHSIDAFVNRYYAPDPTMAALNPGQLRAQANQMVNPYFDRQSDLIRQMIESRGKSGSQAIAGYMNEYMQRAAQVGQQIGNIYQGAMASQGALNAGLADTVAAQGGKMASDLAAAEAAAGQTSSGSDFLQGVAGGAIGANAGEGWGAMSSLNAQAAGAKQYGATLPLIGSLYQGQMLGNFQGQLNTELSDRLAELESQLPGAVQNAYDTLYGRELQKAGVRQGRQSSIADYVRAMQRQNYESAIGAQEFGANQTQQGFANDLALQRQDAQATADATKGSTDWMRDDGLWGIADTLANGTSVGKDAFGRPIIGGNLPAGPNRRGKFVNRLATAAVSRFGIPRSVAVAWAKQMADTFGVYNAPGKKPLNTIPYEPPGENRYPGR